MPRPGSRQVRLLKAGVELSPFDWGLTGLVLSLEVQSQPASCEQLRSPCHTSYGMRAAETVIPPVEHIESSSGEKPGNSWLIQRSQSVTLSRVWRVTRLGVRGPRALRGCVREIRPRVLMGPSRWHRKIAGSYRVVLSRRSWTVRRWCMMWPRTATKEVDLGGEDAARRGNGDTCLRGSGDRCADRKRR